MLKVAKFFQYLTYLISYPILKFFAHLEVEGQENLKGLEDKAVIFASGVHASFIDGPIVGAAMPRHGILPSRFAPLRFLVIDRYFKWKYFPINIFLKANGCVKIHRAKVKYPDGRHLFYVLEHVIDALKKGQKIWIFPEGMLSRDGKLQKGRWGMIFLHQQTGAPIVPVGITGNYKILPFNLFLRKNRLRVRFGKPIYDLKNVSLEEGTEIVMKEIAKLL